MVAAIVQVGRTQQWEHQDRSNPGVVDSDRRAKRTCHGDPVEPVCRQSNHYLEAGFGTQGSPSHLWGPSKAADTARSPGEAGDRLQQRRHYRANQGYAVFAQPRKLHNCSTFDWAGSVGEIAAAAVGTGTDASAVLADVRVPGPGHRVLVAAWISGV